MNERSRGKTGSAFIEVLKASMEAPRLILARNLGKPAAVSVGEDE